MNKVTPSKKPYHTPEFHIYGNIRELTQDNPFGMASIDSHPSLVRKTD